MEFWAFIQGGAGAGFWDEMVKIPAADFAEAARKAVAKAQELGGDVVSLDRVEPPVGGG
jgi:hypothetical protein